MTQSENVAHIEGILSEVDLSEKTFDKDGKKIEVIAGIIKIRTKETINGVNTELEIPVEVFANKYTKNNTINPAYEAAKKVMTEYVSIAAADIDHADRVRITKGNIMMNEYYKDDKLIAFPRISASFITKVKPEECHDEASFILSFIMLSEPMAETDKDGVETGRMKLTGGIAQYGDKLDVVTLYAANVGVINHIKTSWSKGDTVRATGKLNFSSKIEVVETPVDFGEPVKQSRTTRVSDLLITGGNAAPLDGEAALAASDVQAALEARKNRLEELKTKSAKKAAAPAKTRSASDFGF